MAEIDRTGAGALVPEEVANAILTGATAQSAALQLFKRVPMGRQVARMPVISALPTAYFVDGEPAQDGTGGWKQTTNVAWENKYLTAEEIAAIVPIPEAVLDDAGYDVWGTVRPLAEDAIGRALDAAVFFGTNAPSSWPDDIVTAAVAAGNVIARLTNDQAHGGVLGDISDLMALVEADGYDVDGFVATRAFKGRLRSVRDTTGQRLLDVTFDANGNPRIDGQPVVYPARGLWPTGTSAAELIAGDFTMGILGVRQDITAKVLDQAVLQDPSDGSIVYNLAQQDMVALRLTARFAFQVANPINRDQATEANRYPFGVLRSPAA